MEQSNQILEMLPFLAPYAEYITALILVLFGLQKVAEIIVNKTDTPVDNTVYGQFYKVLEKVAGIWGVKAKQLPGEKL